MSVSKHLAHEASITLAGFALVTTAISPARSQCSGRQSHGDATVPIYTEADLADIHAKISQQMTDLEHVGRARCLPTMTQPSLRL